MKYEEHNWQAGTLIRRIYDGVITQLTEPEKSYEFDREALKRLADLLQKQYPNGDEMYDLDKALEILQKEIKEKV